MTTKWIPYTGSPEQIAEIGNSIEHHGFITRNSEGIESLVVCSDTTHYLIKHPHPLADMIIRQAQTGQPVWSRVPIDFKRYGYHYLTYNPTTTPDWNIPGAEYRFTPFEVEK